MADPVRAPRPVGRPRKPEAIRRRGHFLCLFAAGVDPVEARKQAGIDADTALVVACKKDFQQLVQALRDGLLDQATVVTADTEADTLAA